jgi:hypothetical protein
VKAQVAHAKDEQSTSCVGRSGQSPPHTVRANLKFVSAGRQPRPSKLASGRQPLAYPSWGLFGGSSPRERRNAFRGSSARMTWEFADDWVHVL